MSYTSHTRQFPHLKYTVQWLLVYSQIMYNHHYNFRTFSSSQKNHCTLLLLTPCPSLILSILCPNLLCLQKFPYSGHFIGSFLTGFFALSIMFSRFIHVACVSTSFLLWLSNHHILFVHSSVDGHLGFSPFGYYE